MTIVATRVESLARRRDALNFALGLRSAARRCRREAAAFRRIGSRDSKGDIESLKYLDISTEYGNMACILDRCASAIERKARRP